MIPARPHATRAANITLDFSYPVELSMLAAALQLVPLGGVAKVESKVAVLPCSTWDVTPVPILYAGERGALHGRTWAECTGMVPEPTASHARIRRALNTSYPPAFNSRWRLRCGAKDPQGLPGRQRDVRSRAADAAAAAGRARAAAPAGS